MKIDNKIVYIYWKNTVSTYAKLNSEYIAPAPRLIGGSISAVDAMLANGEEQRVLMPTVLGIGANSNDFNTKLANYWNNISVEILSEGRKLEIGFMYDIQSSSKKEYIDSINKTITKEKDKLATDEDLFEYIEGKLKNVYSDFERQYAEASKITDERTRNSSINTLYRNKYIKIIEIEAERYKLGNPINTFDYIVYRYCLVYRDVANEVRLSDKSPNIRFYLHSEKDIELHKKEQKALQNNRIQSFIKATKDVQSMNNVLFALGLGNNLNGMDESDKYVMLEDYSKNSTNTAKFIAVVNDENLLTIAMIEKYVQSNLLYKVTNTSIITDYLDRGKIIGNTMDETIEYFKSDENKATVSEYINRFKALPK